MLSYRCMYVAALWMLLLSLPAQAQQAGRAPGEAFEAGLDAIEAAHYSRAASHLHRAVQSDATYRDGEHGSAAYWLGQSLVAAGDTAAALRSWREGLDAFEAEGSFDAQLADTYLRTAYTAGEEEHMRRGAELYLQLLARADSTLEAPEREIVARHVFQLAIILPEEWQDRVFTDEANLRRGRLDLQPGGGEALLAWWRREDPDPTTEENPRLIEHLQRVAEAEERFGNRRFAAGFDDRGRIFVRLGEPSHTREIQSDKLMRSLHPFVWMTPNEYWVYADVSEEAKYLFVQDRGGYRISGVYDLLPSALQTWRVERGWENDDWMRSRLTIEDAFPALRDFYRQLVTYNVDYADVYSDLMAGSFTGNPTRVMQQVRGTDQRVAERREASVPRHRTDATPQALPLPLDTRIARFLGPDGATRAEVYWAPEPGGLNPAGGMVNPQVTGQVQRYLLEATLVEFGSGYHRDRPIPRYLEAGPEEIAPGSTIPAQTVLAEREDEVFHLALDVRQYATRDPEEARPELLVKRGTARFDSVRALHSEGRQLEMSDLRPMLLPNLEAELQLAEMGPEETRFLAYPFRRLPAEAPLALYFEVYHLTFGDDDRTQYSIEYEIHRQSERDVYDEQQTTTTLEREGTSRKAEELIVLDLSQLEADEGQLEITVRAIDRVTGSVQERRLHFELFMPEE